MSVILSSIILYLPFLLFIMGLAFYILDRVRHSQKGKPSVMKTSREQLLDFTVLVLRWYLAYYMFDYGWGKMTGGQFGVYNPGMLEKPLKDLSKFQIAWYLFGQDILFCVGVGLIQIAGAILIVFNRTMLVGALVLLPVLGQIFLVDVAFASGTLGWVLPLRLSGMIVCDLLILYYYKDRMILVWNNLTNGTTTRFKYKWWVFLLLPALGLMTDFGIGLLTYPFKLLITLLTT